MTLRWLAKPFAFPLPPGRLETVLPPRPWAWRRLLVANRGIYGLLMATGLGGCPSKSEQVRPVVSAISECVYAAGTIKSAQQYQAFASVSGVIRDIYVREGDSVNVGTPLLAVASDVSRLQEENAALSARFADVAANQDQLREARELVAQQRRTMQNDQLQLQRQRRLWAQSIGTKLALEQRELAYSASRTAYDAAVARWRTLERQLSFGAAQARNNLRIAQQQARDFVLRSRVRGVVYKLYPKQGEAISPQTPLAVLGEGRHFVLEMQVDEADIVHIRPGQQVLVTMDSYRGQVFPARVTAVVPLMNANSKTFVVEARFVRQPPVLFPFLSFEASIVLRTKSKALLIPRRLLLNDSTVLNSQGQPVRVKTGLSDYQMVEIRAGLSPADVLTAPES